MANVMRRNFRVCLCLLVMLLLHLPVAAQPAQQLSADVERRLARVVEQFGFDRRLTGFASSPVWSPGGESFIYWSSPTPGSGRWIQVDAATGAERTLIEPDDLRSQLTALTGRPVQLPIGIGFANGQAAGALVFSYEGELFSLDLGSRRLARVEPSSLDAISIDPSNQISPRRDLIAREAEGGGIEVRDALGRPIFSLRGEDQYQWSLPEGAWAPDGSVFLAWRTDSRRVHQLPVVEQDGALERVRYAPHPKAGTPLTTNELYVVDPRRGQSRRLSFTDADGYSFLAGWSRGTGQALILHLSRDGKILDLFGVDLRSEAARRILREERPETFVADLGFISGDWRHQVRPLENGFLWMSERDGWRHVYRYDHSGRLIGRVTSGGFPVHEVAAVSADERTALVLASANPDRPYDRLPYRVSLRGGRLVPLSQEPGTHTLHVSPTGRHFVDMFSSRERPVVSELVSSDGRQRRRFAARDAQALHEWGYRPPESFVATAADGATPIHGVIYRPHDFDASKRYPVVNYVYGGPFTTIVPQTFRGSLDSRFAAALAEAGFIVVLVDGRGTPGRGKAFQDANYGRIGQIEIPDQIAAIRHAAASRPYMDLSRVGITGFSWGGYFALRGIFTAGDFYRAAYAGSPGELSESAMVNEPNMGLPTRNPEGYRLGSNIEAARRLQGALRLMHGTSDTDAPPSTTMRIADALIRADKRFELLLIPGAGHQLGGPHLNYVLRDLALFFMEELGTPQPCEACSPVRSHN